MTSESRAPGREPALAPRPDSEEVCGESTGGAESSSSNLQVSNQDFSSHVGSVCSAIRMGLFRTVISDPAPLHISWTRSPHPADGAGVSGGGERGRGEKSIWV